MSDFGDDFADDISVSVSIQSDIELPFDDEWETHSLCTTARDLEEDAESEGQWAPTVPSGMKKAVSRSTQEDVTVVNEPELMYEPMDFS